MGLLAFDLAPGMRALSGPIAASSKEEKSDYGTRKQVPGLNCRLVQCQAVVLR